MSDNWVVQNLQNALDTWNSKLSEIWQLLTTSPQDFKGGSIWNVMVTINGAVQAIGLALLVLFFVVGVVRTCGSFTEVKKPEHALKLFIRFAIAKGVITYGLELMLALFNIVQGTISTIMTSAGFGTPNQTTLPSEMITTIEECGFFESIPLWAVTLIGGLFITVLSFIMIMTVYGRFFKLYMYTAIAPIPISTFAGEPSQSVGKNFIKSYAGVCLEGAIIALACLLCIRRRSELSGDVAAFPWMRPVLRYGVGCMGGLALGMILYSVTFGLARTNDIRAYLPGMLLCVVLMTLVCSFGMSMLLGKSLKIFRRTWKGTVLLAALLVIWGLWYTRPIGVDTLYPELEPDIIEVYLSDFNTYRHEDRRLKLTAGTEEFDDLWSEIQELRFRRAPFNVVVQALPFLEGIVDTYVKYPETDDLDTMSISFAQDNGTDIWRSEHLQFDVDAWSYRDFDHGVTLPLMMKNGHEIGQKMAHELWEQAAE